MIPTAPAVKQEWSRMYIFNKTDQICLHNAIWTVLNMEKGCFFFSQWRSWLKSDMVADYVLQHMHANQAS